MEAEKTGKPAGDEESVLKTSAPATDAKSGPPDEKVSYFELFRYADTYNKFLISVAVVASAGNGVIMPLFTIVMGGLVNGFNSGGNVQAAVTEQAVKFVYLAAGGGVAAFLQNLCWGLISDNLTNKIRCRYLQSLLRTEIAFFDQASSGELVSRISADVTLISQATGVKMGIFLQFFTQFLAGLIIGLAKGWQLALVILACIPVLAATAGFMVYNITHLASSETKAYSKAGGVAQELFAQIRTVAAFTGEARGLNNFLNALAETRIIGIKSKMVLGVGVGATLLVMFGTYGLALWYGAQLILSNGYTGGDILNVFFAVLIGGFAIGQALPNTEAFTRGQAAGYKIFSHIDRTPAIDSADPGGLKPAKVDGVIELKDVDFVYASRPTQPVFTRFNLSIAAGEFVALVGESGSGKSTVISLIERMYDPSAGAVLLDGIDIRQLNVKWLRQQIGLVSQEPALFATTIRENMLYGKETATSAELEDAARASNAFNFVANLPEKFETMVGERGLQLSGGQKQRIAIARAVLRNPKILLLDEATSALDNESERIVQEALDRLMKGRTTVVVAHRLSTIRDAHSIAVVSSGIVVEKGTYDALLTQGGIFTSLVNLQGGPTAFKEGKTPGASVVAVNGASERGESVVKTAFVDIDVIMGVPAPKEAKGTEAGKDGATKEATPQVPLVRLFGFAAPEWAYFAVGVVSAAGNGAIFPSFAIIFGSLLSVFFEPDPDQLRIDARFWALMFFCLGCAGLIFMSSQSTCSGFIGANLTHRVRAMALQAALRQEVAFYDETRNSSGTLCARLETDASLIRVLVGDAMLLTVQNICTLAAAMAISMVYGWQLALIILSTFPLTIVGSYFQMRTQHGLDGSTREMYESATQVAMDAVANSRTVAAFTADSRVMSLFNSYLVEPLALSHHAAILSGAAYGSAQFLQLAPYSLAFWYAGTLVQNGTITFKDVMVVFFAITMGAIGMSHSVAGLNDAGKAQQAASSVFELIDRKPAIDSTDLGGLQPASVEGVIELRSIDFCYPNRPGVQIFKGFSLLVPAGQVMALVGESGSGKSTVVGLVERFYDPTAGTVLLDGIDIRQLNVKWLRQQIGLVSQEPALFAVSIKENIRYGKEGASDDEIEAAARTANAHGFVSRLPEKFDTQVGERGLQLSGGQKQRIAIARAVLRNPKILLLDEATSALDSESERIVQEALDRLMAGRTTIVVAHRLSTIRDAHCISVVRRGEIVEQGTHDDLATRPDGAYRALMAMRRGDVNESLKPGASEAGMLTSR